MLWIFKTWHYKRDRAILNRMIKEGIHNTLTFEQRPEPGEGESHASTWRMYVLSRKHNKCKGP